MCHDDHMEPTKGPVVVDVGAKGRIVIPAHLRETLGIAEGTRLVAQVFDGALVLAPREVFRAQLLAAFSKVGGSMSKELLAERRDEAVLDEKS
jgi:AbrB family looped-hinge helix DNA binding protein